ncbi:MAG: hypothetical protein HGB12_07475 [Bacteroidetes bacterium]|nr:hypothetical protein [Bacteroidota bacterium]
MKIFLVILFEILNFGLCYSQVTMTIDSATVVTISQLDSNATKKFLDIYSQGYKTNLYSRLDTISYDYAFIQATICDLDSSFKIIERYFISDDSIPKYLFRNGKQLDTKNEYEGFLIWYKNNVTYNYTLRPMLESYSKLKSIQPLPYEKIQIWSHGCVIYEGAEKKYTERRKKEIKHTYQIQTFVDKKKNRIIVSVQTPPKKPKFKTFSYNGVWDW